MSKIVGPIYVSGNEVVDDNRGNAYGSVFVDEIEIA